MSIAFIFSLVEEARINCNFQVLTALRHIQWPAHHLIFFFCIISNIECIYFFCYYYSLLWRFWAECKMAHCFRIAYIIFWWIPFWVCRTNRNSCAIFACEKCCCVCVFIRQQRINWMLRISVQMVTESTWVSFLFSFSYTEYTIYNKYSVRLSSFFFLLYKHRYTRTHVWCTHARNNI